MLHLKSLPRSLPQYSLYCVIHIVNYIGNYTGNNYGAPEGGNNYRDLRNYGDIPTETYVSQDPEIYVETRDT